jgi:hypothetical protein
MKTHSNDNRCYGFISYCDYVFDPINRVYKEEPDPGSGKGIYFMHNAEGKNIMLLWDGEKPIRRIELSKEEMDVIKGSHIP